MAASSQKKFDAAQQLDILAKMRPCFQQYLIPSQIVPRLGSILTRDERDHIIEVENGGSRSEAVKLLIDSIIRRREQGINIFLAALQSDNDTGDPGWPRFLRPLGVSDAEDINRHPNEYYSFLVHLLEGDIIEHLSRGQIETILIELQARDVVADYEMELILARLDREGRYKAAVQLFSLLGLRTEDWLLGFFQALRAAAPEILQKMVPYGIDPIVEKPVEDPIGGGDNFDDPGDGHGGPDDGSGRHYEDDDPYSDDHTWPKRPLTGAHTAGLQGFSTAGCSGSDEKEAESVPEKEIIEVKVTQEKVIIPAKRTKERDSGSSSDEGIADIDPGFSDDEKQEGEEMEKLEGQPGRVVSRALELRNYQRELASNALQGINTIICAPTGSGKTRVALHIVMEHLLSAAKKGIPCKVVFLARTLPLVSQQYQNFKQYLPQYRCELVTGDSVHCMDVHHILDKVDILVLTPKILENHLRPDKIPSLATFSLIVFDECHHTRKGEPYMSVMKHYLQCKQKKERGLPQIVGLTASIGVEKATTTEEARESLLGIMANLDVTVISEVIENKDELLEKVPRPDEELKTLVPREQDDISRALSNVMHKLVEELEGRAQYVKDDRQLKDLLTLLHKHETDVKSQKFGQWAVMLRNKAKLQPKTPKNEREMELIMKRKAFCWEVQSLAEWLIMYNEAFDVHDLSRPADVLSYLDRKSDLLRDNGKEFLSTELDSKVQQYYKEIKSQLEKSRNNRNPNLETLGKTILQHIRDAGDDTESFRILVFVRTRATCQALSDWLNSEDVDGRLQALKAKYFTGTGAKGFQGGMTQYEQVEALKKFNEGSIKLLVTTSVGEEGIDIADCNLTIRYNHVGNEVTTVQTRGRSRKRGGRSILMAMPKIIEQEELNRKRMELMYQALDSLRTMSKEDIQEFVRKAQVKTLEAEEIDQLMKDARKQKTEADFSVACPQCHKVKVNGSQIRKVNNAHHVLIGHEIEKEIVIMPGRTFFSKDDWEMQGSVVCKCKAKLGQLLVYKKAKFIIVSPKQWVFLDKEGNPSSYKQWSKVPYHIEDLHPEDIKEHLNTGSDDQGAASGAS